MNKRIAMVIAHEGFRDEEYWVPKEILENAGVEITTVSSGISPAKSKYGKTTPVDAVLEDISADVYDAVLFVGGPGTKEYFHSEPAHKLAQAFNVRQKITSAICIAPVILANAGLLQGKRATVFPTGKQDLEQAKAVYTGGLYEVDGHIITGSGPEAAREFAQEIVKKLEINIP